MSSGGQNESFPSLLKGGDQSTYNAENVSSSANKHAISVTRSHVSLSNKGFSKSALFQQQSSRGASSRQSGGGQAFTVRNSHDYESSVCTTSNNEESGFSIGTADSSSTHTELQVLISSSSSSRHHIKTNSSVNENTVNSNSNSLNATKDRHKKQEAILRILQQSASQPPPMWMDSSFNIHDVRNVQNANQHDHNYAHAVENNEKKIQSGVNNHKFSDNSHSNSVKFCPQMQSRGGAYADADADASFALAKYLNTSASSASSGKSANHDSNGLNYDSRGIAIAKAGVGGGTLCHIHQDQDYLTHTHTHTHSRARERDTSFVTVRTAKSAKSCRTNRSGVSNTTNMSNNSYKTNLTNFTIGPQATPVGTIMSASLLSSSAFSTDPNSQSPLQTLPELAESLRMLKEDLR